MAICDNAEAGGTCCHRSAVFPVSSSQPTLPVGREITGSPLTKHHETKRMNVIIFGASRGTGRQLVEQAKARGHRVTAFARHPDASLQSDLAVQVLRGDLLDAAAV